MNWLISAILNWLVGYLTKIVGVAIVAWQKITAYKKTNNEIAEQTEHAETPEERQAALDRAGSHLGRH